MTRQTRSALKDRIRELARNPEIISGIHNYCDRWCERCAFTSRCMNFAVSDEQLEDPAARDINNGAFWERLGETLHASMELLQEAAVDRGIELTADTDAPGIDERLDQDARDHECSQAAGRYHKMVDAWFQQAEPAFAAKGKELTQQVEMDLPGDTPREDAGLLKDAVEVIRWYEHFIWVKLMRAIRGRMDEDLDGDEFDEYPKDSDGSAKIALIAMDRSLAAWGELFRQLSDCEDDILDILLHLDRLRKNTEAAFPNARAFIRPGFDEG